MKTRIRSRRGFSYFDHVDWFTRTDKNRRRADWYFERVMNNCLSAWEQSEAFGREMRLQTASKVCDCMDNLTCRCMERLFLGHTIRFLKSCRGTYIEIPHVKMVRAWFISEYGIKGYEMDNLRLIEEWESFELEEPLSERERDGKRRYFVRQDQNVKIS